MRLRGHRPGMALAIVSFLVSVAMVEAWLAYSPRYRDIARPYRERLADFNVIGEPYLEVGDDVPYTTRRSYKGTWAGEAHATITTNPQGFRVTRPRAVEQFQRADVLCMGDSFTFGYLVDDADTWPALLGLLYSGKGQVVVNAGYTGGFSFDGAALHYRRVLTGLRPRVVVYAVFPDNDISDLGNWSGMAADGGPRAIRTTNQLLSERAWQWPVLRESRLFVGFHFLWSRRLLRRELEMAEALRWPHADLAIRDFTASTASEGARLIFVFLREPNDVYVRSWGGDRVDEYRVYREGNIAILKAILTRHGVEWHDDQDLLAELHAGLQSRHMPPLPKGLAASADEAAARAEWRPEVLTARDRVHYSGFTNRYVAAWLQRVIDSPDRPD